MNLRTAILAIALIFGIQKINAQISTNAKSFELREGVIIDANQKYMYLMDTLRETSAFQLLNGKRVWRRRINSKPLHLINNLLICQEDLMQSSNTFKIVVLDTKRAGRLVYRDSIKLDEDVQVSIDVQRNHSFKTVNKVFERSLYIFWKYTFQETKPSPFPDPAPDLNKVIEGILKISPNNRRMTIISENNVPNSLKQLPVNLTSEELLKGNPEIQFRSSNNKHALVIRRVGDERTWDKYLWLIHERGSGSLIGTIRNYSSYNPFFISNQRIVLETGPYFNRLLGNKPLSIQSLELKSGKEYWSVPIRNTSFKGNYPLK